MTSFKRFNLITQEELERLRQRQISTYDPELRAAARVEDEILSLLDKRGLSPEDKIAKLQILQHQLQQLKEDKLPQAVVPAAVPPPAAVPAPVPAAAVPPAVVPAPVQPPPAALPAPVQPKAAAVPMHDVALLLPVGMREKATQIIDYIKPRVSHDELNRLVLDGEPVKDTNFIDLMHTVLSGKTNKRPNGLEQFVHTLKTLNLPSTLITNKAIRDSLQYPDQAGQGLTNPPGKPVKILRLY